MVAIGANMTMSNVFAVAHLGEVNHVSQHYAQHPQDIPPQYAGPGGSVAIEECITVSHILVIGSACSSLIQCVLWYGICKRRS